MKECTVPESDRYRGCSINLVFDGLVWFILDACPGEKKSDLVPSRPPFSLAPYSGLPCSLDSKLYADLPFSLPLLLLLSVGDALSGGGGGGDVCCAATCSAACALDRFRHCGNVWSTPCLPWQESRRFSSRCSAWIRSKVRKTGNPFTSEKVKNTAKGKRKNTCSIFLKMYCAATGSAVLQNNAKAEGLYVLCGFRRTPQKG